MVAVDLFIHRPGSPVEFTRGQEKHIFSSILNTAEDCVLHIMALSKYYGKKGGRGRRNTKVKNPTQTRGKCIKESGVKQIKEHIQASKSWMTTWGIYGEITVYCRLSTQP